MTPSHARSDPGPAVLSERIDSRAGVVSASGVLTRPGADLLRGAVEVLAQLGHRRITLDLTGLHGADDEGAVALGELGRRTAGRSRPGLVVLPPRWAVDR